tara:strand:+ start:1421 stop:2359 length:939 start_codon:yes stop_codon:yes gene_type:complete
MKKVLVTGGLGFIGSNLIDNLLLENESIVLVDNLSSSRPDYSKKLKEWKGKVEFLNSCFSDKIVTNRVLKSEFKSIFHLAAIPRVAYSVENPVETTDVNLLRVVKLLECVSKVDTRFIFSSSSSVYGGAEELPTPSSYKKNPKSPYAWQKSCIEDLIDVYVHLKKVDAVSLRYFNVFGPGQYGGSAYSTAIAAWCDAIKNKKNLRKDGTGNQSRDMCYVDNVVQANLLAHKRKKIFSGQRYNVACGDRVSNNEILEAFKSRYSELTIEQAPFRKGDVMHTQADISSTEKDLGYKARVDFWEGLDKTFKWWKI